jgi:hypothetical protein
MEAAGRGEQEQAGEAGVPACGPTRQMLQRVARVACGIGHADEAAVLLYADGLTLARVAAHDRPGTPAAAVSWADAGVVAQALGEGVATAENNGDGGPRAAAPVIVAGRPRGVVAVSAGGYRPGFHEVQLELLADLAAIVATALERAETRSGEAAEAGLTVLASAVDLRDDYTGEHSDRVGQLSRRVGTRLGMEEAELDMLECAARLHDVGKLRVPDSILRKPGPLDEDEWIVMRRHPDWGADMVARMPGLEPAASLVRAHHERWDGGGYPVGLARDGIPLASRVICACDAFEAMIANRPDRDALSPAEALSQLAAGAGAQFDPAVVLAAVETVKAGAVRNGGAEETAVRI